jgi:hypothetical protein
MISPDGLRWQSPELMSGRSLLTKADDIYAFAICIMEILTMVALPRPTVSDEEVRRLVQSEFRAS